MALPKHSPPKAGRLSQLLIVYDLVFNLDWFEFAEEDNLAMKIIIN